MPKETAPCPYCKAPLRTALAKQCFACGMDWHNPASPKQLKPADPNWNPFGILKDLVYVVELCQKPNGQRYVKYRAVDGGTPDPHRVFESEPAPGWQFIEWGYYEYSKHLRLTTGERFGFEAHGIWLTEAEMKYMSHRWRGLATGQAPWVNGIPPNFPPK